MAESVSVRQLRRMWSLLDRAGRRKIVVLTALMAVGSALEALGIGLVLPFLRAVSDAEAVFSHEVAGPAARALGIDTRNELMVGAGLGLIGVFLFKNAYVGAVWYQVYGFAYGQFVELARRLLEGYLEAPFTFHLQRNSAELIRNATNETERIFSGAVRPGMELFAELVVVVGLVAVLTYVHALAAGLVLGLMTALGWGLTSTFRRKLREIGRMRAENQARIYQAVNQGLGGAKQVKLLGRERFFADAFRESAAALANSYRNQSFIRLSPRLVLETGAVVGLVGLSGLLVFTETGVIDAIPVLGVFAVAIVRLMPSVNRVVSDVNQIRYEAPAVDLVYEELRDLRGYRREGGFEARDGLPGMRLQEEIEVRDLSYAYPTGSAPALRGVSFTVARGEEVGIVGASGSGKTTLVNLVLGLLEPSSGDIQVDGTSVRNRLPAWQRQLGYIPQDIYLTDDSVRRNVAFGLPDPEIDDARVWAALEAAQLAQFVRGLEGGLDAVVGERGVRVSGGQRQRIGIARALYHEPEVLVLDEATSSLDYETERNVMRAVEALAGEKTVLIVTHRLRTVRNCDAIHVLEEGELAATGTYEELMEESARFRRLAREEEDEAEDRAVG